MRNLLRLANISRASDLLLIACAFILAVCLTVAVISGLNWPLVGDTSIMHYVVFALSNGAKPYKDLIDINLPGTYFFEALAMKIFGWGAFGWRLYDSFLILANAGACLVVCGAKRWFAAVFAACLFGLAHLQDGVAQGGQRDLLIAVLLLWGYAAFLKGIQRSRSKSAFFFFGLMLGCTIPIKPVLLPLCAALLMMQLAVKNEDRQLPYRQVLVSLASLLLPSAVALAWLKAEGTLHIFLGATIPLIRLHASLGNRPASYLITHSTSPFGALLVFWALLLAIDRPKMTLERLALLLGVGGTFAGYFVQSKGYPYQRYPLLALLLLLVAIDVEQAFRRSGHWRRAAAVGCILSGCVLATLFSLRTASFSATAPFQSALKTKLNALTGYHGGRESIQCLDTFGGCVGTLYDIRLTQSTGFIYDCYLFTGESQERSEYRSSFAHAFLAAAPRIVVITNQFCFSDVRGFDKVALWPTFASYLAANYDLETEWRSTIPQHWWSRNEDPTRFRIYLRRQQ